MAMLPRIKPRTFYDLVIQVVEGAARSDPGRHGPPLFAPPGGLGARDLSRPKLEKVLGKTLGVPLLQEQAMRVAIECAGFAATEADQVRRAKATFTFTAASALSGLVDDHHDRKVHNRATTKMRGSRAQ
jgi:error-prone DNA polymerase